MKKYHTSSIIIILGISFLLAVFQKTQGNTPGFPVPAGSTLAESPVLVDTLDIEIMDPATGVQFYRDGVIILSNSKYQQKMIADHISFGLQGTFLVRTDDLAGYNNQMFISGNPFPVNPDGMAFSGDHKMLYFTSPADGRAGNNQIYSVPVEDSRTSAQAFLNPSDITAMPFCSEKNNYMHPAVAADNSFMIFVSDNPESVGGFDLFLVKREGNKWGKPENMGKSLNTKKNELYPCLDDGNNLFFSSDGHSGFGGMDIFMCRFIDNGWGSPVNIMKSFNSEYDDVALKIDADNRTGYFTSQNMPGEKKKQLYKISLSQSGKLTDALFLQAQNEYRKLFEEEIADATVKTSTTTLAETNTLNEESSEAVTTGTTATTVAAPASTTPVATSTATTTAAAATTTTGAATTAAATTTAATTTTGAATTTAAAATTTAAAVTTTTGAAASTAVPDAGEEEKDVVIFRVQIVSSTNPKSNYRVTVDGKSYPTFEYLYKGAYRYTVGEFRSVGEANAFRTKCKSSGFSQAFVAAFINDERVTDPSVFK